jgi:hypothetical protein
MKRLRLCLHCALVSVTYFNTGLRGQTAFSLREGVVDIAPRPSIAIGVSPIQPALVTPPMTCAGRQVTLTPPAGQNFPATADGVRVLFSPCGIPGKIVSWAPDRIVVGVPDQAEDGPVWLATDVSAQAAAELDRGAACLRSIAQHDVEPERPAIVCDAKVGDLVDPQLSTKLRGTPTSDASVKSPAPPVFRAEERSDTDPPACKVVEPDRRGPVSYKGISKQFQVSNNSAEQGSCFETCQQVRVVNNFLKVEHAPRIERFMPTLSRLRVPREHRVERGRNRVEWQVVSDTGPADLWLVHDSAPATAVPLVSSTDIDVREVRRLTLSGRNTCGTAGLTIALEPETTLHVTPERLDLDAGVPAELRVAINTPLTASIDVALDNSSSGMVAVTPAVVTIPAGATEVRAQVQLVGHPPAARAQIGQITARLASTTAVAGTAPVIDSPDPSRLYGRSVMAVMAPGPDQVLVQGRLRYRECLGEGVFAMPLAPTGGSYTLDADRCLLDGSRPVFKPVRRARVEIWDQAPFPNELRHVVDTDNTGLFQALVPASGSYDVTVVASSLAGQVNLENDAITWFWRPLHMRQTGSGGATLNYNFDFGRADARHFNALDAITRGLEYALQENGTGDGAADATFRKAVVIPGSASTGTTLVVGNASHIWIGAWNEIFDDDVALHEYGHHMQHANGTYQLWATPLGPKT